MGKPNQHTRTNITPFQCFDVASSLQPSITTTTTTEKPDVIIYPSGSICGYSLDSTTTTTTTVKPIFEPESGVIYPEGLYKVSDINIAEDGCGPYKLTLSGEYAHLFRIIDKALYFTGGSNILCPPPTTTTTRRN